jgi:hypothetical protein
MRVSEIGNRRSCFVRDGWIPSCEITMALSTVSSSARCSIRFLSTRPIASPKAATTTMPMTVNRPSTEKRAESDRMTL